jgi:cytochrome c oxidase cbb3-type subunit 3
MMLYRLLISVFLAGIGISHAYAMPNGAMLYARNCAACHGSTGTGGIGVPLALPSFQASISDDYLRPTWQSDAVIQQFATG